MSEGNGQEVPGAVAKVVAQVLVVMYEGGRIGAEYAGNPIVIVGMLDIGKGLVMADAQKPKSGIIVPKPSVPNLHIQP